MSQPVGLEPPPLGVVPNFVNPESTGYKVIITTIVTWTIATSIICLRAYVKLRIMREILIDDWFILVAWLFATGLCSTPFLTVYQYGLGRHAYDVLLSSFNRGFLQTSIAFAVLYQMSICFAKLSILVFYLRLSPFQGFRIAVYLLMILTISYTIILFFQIIFRCHPIHKSWDITIQYGSCLPIKFVSLFNGFCNTITDCVILFLPIPLTWKLRVPRRQKVLVVLILMTSSTVVVVSILRLVENFFSYGQDVTKGYVLPALYGVLEANIATTCACLPLLKPLVARCCPKILGERSEGSSHTAITQPQDGARLPSDIVNSTVLPSESQDMEAC